jgi:adenylate cyclase
LLVASYLAINFTDTYLDFTAPITWAVIYFSVAKIYALANDRVMQRMFTNDVEMGRKGTSILLMPIAIEASEPLSENKVKKFQRRLEQHCRLTASVQSLKGTQTGIWGLFSDIIIISWTYHAEDAEEVRLVKEDSEQLANALKTLPHEFGLSNSSRVRYAIHEGTLNMNPQELVDANSKDDSNGGAKDDLSDIGHHLASQWRRIFAEALIKLEAK